jgi:ribosome-binding factor A
MRSQDFTRSRRVADQIGRELAVVLIEEVDDPRLRGLTVSGVDLSPDMRNATVFVTLPADGEVPAALAALDHARGLLRRRLGQRVRLKYLPALRFVHDTTLDRAERIERLLRGQGTGGEP